MNLSRSLLNIWINKLNYSKSLNNGTLKGLRMGVKDVFWTEELPTTAASKMLKDFHKKEDATCVRLAKNNGAILTGKTNCDEFGMGYVYQFIFMSYFSIDLFKDLQTEIQNLVLFYILYQNQDLMLD